MPCLSIQFSTYSETCNAKHINTGNLKFEKSFQVATAVLPLVDLLSMSSCKSSSHLNLAVRESAENHGEALRCMLQKGICIVLTAHPRTCRMIGQVSGLEPARARLGIS